MKNQLVILLLLALLAASGVQAAGLSTQLSQVDASKFPAIGVVLGVFSRTGQPVPGLTRDDFTMDEDGASVAIVSVDVEKTPLSLALVLDVSGSMKPAIDQLKAAVCDFITSLEPHDRAMVMTFSDKVRIREELTAARGTLLDAVGTLEAEGATALYDAMHQAVRHLSRVEGRRMAVVFSDGRDRNSTGTKPQSIYSPRAVAQLARQAQVPLWNIGMGQDIDQNLLEKLSALTGGRSYMAADASELRKAFGDVMTDVRLQYRLTYKSPKPEADGTVRKLQVTSTVKGEKDQGSIGYKAPGPAPVAPPTPDIPARVAGDAGPASPPLATSGQTATPGAAGTGAIGSYTIDTGITHTVIGGGGVSVAGPGGLVGVGNAGNINVTGPTGAVRVGGTGNVNVTGPSGTVGIGNAGNINVTGPSGAVNVNPGQNVSVKTGQHSIDVKTGQVNIGGPGGNITLDGNGLNVQGAGGRVHIGADGTLDATGAAGSAHIGGSGIPGLDAIGAGVDVDTSVLDGLPGVSSGVDEAEPPAEEAEPPAEDDGVDSGE